MSRANIELGGQGAVQQTGLRAGTLGTVDIIFLVLAAAAPMAVVVATMPLAFALGNGPGVAGTFLLAGLAMAFFTVGYVRLIPHIRNAGAFYAIIAQSFGKRIGLASAYVALLSYVALCCATLGAFSYFAVDLLVRTFGASPPWGVIATAVIALLAILAYFRIDFTAKILAIALAAEVLAILALDLAIVWNSGGASPAFVFDPGAVFAPGLGVAAIYAFNSCIGFEATAIYQEEARDRERSVPKATYAAIGIVCIFYVFTAYSFTVASGRDIGAVAGSNPGHYVFGLANRYLGPSGEWLLSILVVTSAFAAVLGLFNNSVRYLFAMARDGVMPSALARTRAENGSPFRSALPVAVIMVIVVTGFALAGLDPLLSLTTALTGLGSVGLMALLSVTAFAVPAYFFRRKLAGGSAILFPVVGGAMLTAGTLLSVLNYPMLTGTDSRLVNALPIILLAAAALGAGQASWLRRHRPACFSRIGSSRIGDP